MKRNTAITGALTFVIISGTASASFLIEATGTPLRLDYSVTDIGGGLLDYEFTLTLDNNDGTWVAGQDFNWIIWGDASGMASPLADFVGDLGDLPIGPFTFYTSSSGAHNGPTLLRTDPFIGWIPGAIGESLFWSGTSANFLDQGELLWSNLLGSGKHANFVVANLIPAPGAAGLLLLCLVGTRRRRAA